MSRQSELDSPKSATVKGKDAKIALAKPYFDGSELLGIKEALDSGWVTQGPKIAEFEQAFAAYVGAPYAVATSNCTTAMHIGWLIAGIGPGHDVLCPSYSFIASANAIRHAGANPVFVDIDAQTLNIDVNEARRCIEETYDGQLKNKLNGNKLKAILIVHQIGIPCDIEAFSTLCNEFGLLLVEDAACAIGSSYKNKLIGSSGNICAFSFHPRKVITTGEGGMLSLCDRSLADNARVYRAHGMSVSDLERHKSGSTTFESYEVIGYNYRMTDIQAAVGISQLQLLEWIVARRNEIGARYNEAFTSVSGLQPVIPASYATRWNYQSYHLTLKNADSAQRNMLMDFLEHKGISTRRGIPPIHKEPVYQKAHAGQDSLRKNKNGTSLKVTEQVSQSSFFIPIYPQLTGGEVDFIIDSVIEGFEKLKK